MGLAIANHEHCCAEPFPVEPFADRYPVEFEILVTDAFVCAVPALFDPRILTKIRFLRLQKTMCQCLPDTAPEREFQPHDQSFHDSEMEWGGNWCAVLSPKALRPGNAPYRYRAVAGALPI